MSNDHRLRAQQQLANLLELLRAEPDRARFAPLIELGEHLERAIASFHMEAIRSRMYSLGRRIGDPETKAPAQAHTLFDAIRVSLEAAGFHTRSITH